MHPNQRLIEDFFGAFANGDVETLRRIFADDVVMIEPGNTDCAGEYRGQEEVFAFFAKLGERTKGSLKIERIHDILANDERAVAIFEVSGERDGEPLGWRVNELYEIRDGKIQSIQAFVFDVAPLDKAYAPA